MHQLYYFVGIKSNAVKVSTHFGQHPAAFAFSRIPEEKCIDRHGEMQYNKGIQ